MKLITRLLVRNLPPLFFSSLLMFVILIEILDLFANIVQYQNQGATFMQILEVQLYYLPMCISYALPIACLFSVALTVGNFSANNELIAVLSLGTSLYRSAFPVILVGLLLSVFGFFFQEYVVIETYRQKTILSSELLNRSREFNSFNVAVRADQGRRVYYAEYYDDTNGILEDVIIIDLDTDLTLVRRIDAKTAQWNEEEQLELRDVKMYNLEDPENISFIRRESFSDESFIVSRQAFQGGDRDIEEMRIDEARAWLDVLADAGADYRRQQATFLSRFSFTVTPLIVTLIACSLTGRFRKNIVLMSLLLSLAVSVSYYILRIMGIILSADGILSPFVAAFGASILFFIFAIILFIYAPT